MTRYIYTKHEGVCKHCGKSIPAGHRARWTKGSGIAHPTCWAPETVSARKARGKAMFRANLIKLREKVEAASARFPEYVGKIHAAPKRTWAKRLGVPQHSVRRAFRVAREAGVIGGLKEVPFRGMMALPPVAATE